MSEFKVEDFIRKRENTKQSLVNKAEPPDRGAEIYQISRDKSLPYRYVQNNLEKLNKPVIGAEGPALDQLMRDREKVSLIMDDLDNLRWWETAGREVKNIFGLFPASAYSISSAGYATLGSVFNTLSDLSTAPFRGSYTEEEIRDQDLFGMAGRYFMGIAQDQQLGVQQNMPDETILPSSVVSGILSAITNIPAIAASVATRNPNIALSVMGTVSYGESYRQAQEDGLSNLNSVIYATNNALAEVITERMPLTQLIKDVGADAGFIRTIANQMIQEIPQEQVATLWQDISEWASLNPEKTLSEFAAERPSRAVDTLISTIVATGLQTSVVTGLDRLTRTKEQQILEQVAEKANESKVNQRTPDVFQEYLQSVDNSNVYLNAEEARALFQDLDQDAAYNLIAEQIDEAQAVGGDIVIPMDKFASQVATSPNFEKLKPLLRLSPDSPTEKDFQPQRVEELLKEANQNIEMTRRSNEIYQEVTQQLIDTGRLDRQTAKVSASIIPAYVTTKAIRTGLTVDEVYSKMGLKVVGPQAEVQGREILDQAKQTGYEGESIGEALEWRRAREKGLDMSTSYTNEDLNFFKDQGLLTDQEMANLESDENTRTARQGIPGEQRPQTVVKQVYRGGTPLQTSDFQALGKSTGHPSASLGVWFTSDQADAATYGDVSEHTVTLSNPKSYSIEEDIPAFNTPEEYTQFREQLQAQGHDGIVFDYSAVDGPVHYVAFEPESVDKTLFQDEKAPRGTISILPDSLIIKLTEASDTTTFLHEAGHAFLEMEGKLYDTNEQTKADGDIILKWLGAESFDSITVEQHEKWARGFEKYLGEGKAPSVELQSVFRRFAAWLRQVYRNLTRLNVELSDEIRDVMDRLLATDEQIDRMKGRFRPLFESAEDAGVTQAEYQAYTRNSTPETAKEALQAKLLKQLERQHKQWWKNESQPIKDRIEKELLEQPVYKAVDEIRKGQKLNREEVKSLLGVEKLPSRFTGLTSKDGLSPDDAAGLYGLSSGQELVNQINAEPTLRERVDALAYAEMVKRHGDALRDGTLQEMAEQAARNPDHAKKLSAEIAYLSRKSNRPAIDREVLKEYAREKIGKLPYKKIYPNQYRAAEVRAARAAAVAKSQNKLEEALRYKQQELTNFYLAKEAQIQKDKALNIRAYLKGVQSRKYDSKNIDTEIVNQAKVLISAFDFRMNNRESVDLAQARLQSVRNWIKSQNVDPEAVSNYVEAEVLGKLIPYDQMRTEDLRGLEDVVKSILFGAKQKANAKTLEYQRSIDEGREYLIDNRIETYETEYDTDVPWVKVKNFGQQFFASLRKFESLVRQADGMNEQGWLWRHTVKPLLDAANNQLTMRRESFDQLNKIFEGHNQVFNGLKDRRTFTLENGRKIRLSYGARISMALNTGNQGNLDALLTQGITTPGATPLMTQRDVDNVLSTLSDKDWDLVQNVWDYVDTFWPQISELEIKRSGVAPQKVEARPFVTPTGKQMRGGYYPLVGDPMEDSKQLDQDISAMADAMRAGGTAKKTTKHGSTIERVGFGGKKINLSIDVLFNHIDGIVHDITHWEAVRDVDRVLRNPKISEELNTSLGKPGARVLKDRLTEIAAGPIRTNGLGAWNRMLRHARLAATYSALGYSVRTALMNTMGLTTAIADMDARQISAGAYEFYTNPKQMTDFVLSKSTYMQDRGEVLNRDVAYIRANLKGNTTFNKFKDNAFWLMTKTDQAITRPIWLAAYRQGETMFTTEKEAIDYADRMVARTQGSGFDLDLSNVETRNEFVKSMTVMFSAMNAIYNISAEQIKRYKGGKITLPQLMAKMSWLVVIPGLIELLIVGGEDDEPLPQEMVGSVIFYGLGLFPIARDIASYSRYGSTFPTPIVELGKAPIDVVTQLSQGEVDKALIRSIGSAAGWAHIPGGAQMSRTLGYLTEVQDNEIDEFSPYDMIVTGRERSDLVGE